MKNEISISILNIKLIIFMRIGIIDPLLKGQVFSLDVPFSYTKFYSSTNPADSANQEWQ